jgi:predicted nucleic acid-binding protein
VAGLIVLDASVLIAHLDANDANHRRAETALLGTTEHDLAASSITLAEVLVGPARAGRLKTAQAALHDLSLAEVPVPSGAAEQLATLRAQTGLKLPDCCVLLAAQQMRADGVLTFDERLAKRAGESGYGWVPVR